MGLPRELRLRHRADFARVAEEGKGRANGLVVLRFAPNTLSIPRSGFSVSKRVGTAVRRNRVKRLLREAVRNAPLKGGYDLVFIARLQSAEANYRDIKSAVEDVLRRARLLERGGTDDKAPRTANGGDGAEEVEEGL